MSTDKILERHLTRTAMIYIRQSTLQQVKNNTGSTRRQYALAERARHLGFRQVEVIDEDLGVSGSGHSERRGFKRLIAAVCCGEVGAVFALEASRLARNNRDWHHLLELCMLGESLVIDDDGVYDPRVLNDRLLLGLKGTMSEFELGMLRQRAQEAYRGKIARGEVLTRVPIGYVRDGSHGMAMTPDRRVQESIRGLFELFARLGTLRQALLWYHQQGVRFPARRGIGGDEHVDMQNQRTLTQNSTRSHQVSAGAPREGNALLGGLLRCGKCGHKLQVRYRGIGHGIRCSCIHGLREQGKPRCIQFGGFRVDEKIAGEVLAACRPLAIGASLRAFEQEHDHLSRKKQALEMALEDARYEAGRARRQYDAVDPENRLVCAELEKRWDEALQRAGQAEERLKQEDAPRAAVSDGQKQRLMRLGENFGQVWHDPGAPVELKKRVIRSLIHEIIVAPDESKGIIDLNIHWAGGVHTRCAVTKNKSGHSNSSTGKNIVEIVRVYAQAWSDACMATMLNRLGLNTGAGNSWNETRVKNLRLYNQIPVYSKGAKRSWLTMSEAAGQLHVSACVVNTMVKHRLLPARQQAKGAPWLIEAADLELPAVRNYAKAHLAGKKAPREDPSQIIISYL